MEFHGEGRSYCSWVVLCRRDSGSINELKLELGRPGGGIKGGTPGATTCARNRTLVACVSSIDDGSDLELELVNGGTRRTKG